MDKIPLTFAEKTTIYTNLLLKFGGLNGNIISNAVCYSDLDYYVGRDFKMGDLVMLFHKYKAKDGSFILMDNAKKLASWKSLLQKRTEIQFVIVTKKSMYPKIRTNIHETDNPINSLKVTEMGENHLVIDLNNTLIAERQTISCIRDRVYLPYIIETVKDEIVDTPKAGGSIISVGKVHYLEFWKAPLEHLQPHTWLLIAYQDKLFKVPIKDFRVKAKMIPDEPSQYLKKYEISLNDLEKYIEVPF